MANMRHIRSVQKNLCKKIVLTKVETARSSGQTQNRNHFWIEIILLITELFFLNSFPGSVSEFTKFFEC